MILLVTISSIFSATALATSQSGITYQGRILKPDGTSLQGANVQFRLQLRTPNASNCLMYEEIQSLDMRNSNGVFGLTMNDGTGTRTDSTTLGLDRVLANRGSFTFDPTTCSTGTTYTPSVDDGRRLAVLFKDETMTTWEPIPSQTINYVPFAIQALQLQGFDPTALVRVQESSGAMGNVSPLSNANYIELLAIINGTSAQYTKSAQLGGSALPTMTSGQVLGWNGSNWISQDPAPSAGSITTTQLANNVSISTSGTVASAVSTTRDFKLYASSPSTYAIDFQTPALASSYALVWPATSGFANQVLATDGTGALSWVDPSTSQWLTTGSSLSYASGNVGIGTTAPGGPLHVAGTSSGLSPANVSGLFVESSGSLNSFHTFLVGSTGGGYSFKVTNAGNVGIGTAYTAPLAKLDVEGSGGVILNAGNVGIGTTSPDAALTINANSAPPLAPNAGSSLHVAGANNSSSAITVDAYGANFYDSPYITLRKTRGTAASPASTSQYDILGQIQFMGYQGGFISGPYISGEAIENWTSTAKGSKLGFGVMKAGTTTSPTSMTLQGNGLGINLKFPLCSADHWRDDECRHLGNHGSELSGSRKHVDRQQWKRNRCRARSQFV